MSRVHLEVHVTRLALRGSRASQRRREAAAGSGDAPAAQTRAPLAPAEIPVAEPKQVAGQSCWIQPMGEVSDGLWGWLRVPDLREAAVRPPERPTVAFRALRPPESPTFRGEIKGMRNLKKAPRSFPHG